MVLEGFVVAEGQLLELCCTEPVAILSACKVEGHWLDLLTLPEYHDKLKAVADDEIFTERLFTYNSSFNSFGCMLAV